MKNDREYPKRRFWVRPGRKDIWSGTAKHGGANEIRVKLKPTGGEGARISREVRGHYYYSLL